jgi:hypothetical protein
MLVLEHEETLMTNGILLNRPTSRIITDEYSNSWNVWYGGPVRGIHDDIDSSQGEQQLAWTCLHSLTNPVAKRLSNQIIKDIQWTTLETAQFLVENGRTKQLYSLLWICILESWSAPTRIATKQLVHDLGGFANYITTIASSRK